MQVKRDRQQAKERLQEMEKAIKPLEKAVAELNERMKMLRAELRNKVRNQPSTNCLKVLNFFDL